MTKNVNETIIPEVESNEVAVIPATPEIERRDDIGTMISVADFHAPAETNLFSTIVGTDRKSKVKVYNAISAPDKKIAECMGDIIEIKDFVAHEVTVLDEKTGELANLVRTVIIATDGTSYEAVSIGVANSLQRLISFLGHPSEWEEPVKVKVKQKGTRNGDNKVTLLEIVE